MRNFAAPLIGILLWSAAAAASAQSSDTSFYGRIKRLTQLQLLFTEAELPVERYTAALYYDNPADPLIVFEQDIDLALQEKFTEFCQNENEEQGLDISIDTCSQGQDIVRTISERTSYIRSLGRDLQLIASGYEAGSFAYPGRAFNITARMPSISSIWRATNQEVSAEQIKSDIRGVPFQPDALEELDEGFQEIVQLLDDLIVRERGKEDDTAFVAAMWRYQHGLQQVINQELREPCDDDPDPQEQSPLFNLERRFCELEDTLEDFQADALSSADLGAENQQEEIEKARKSGETILLPSFVDVGKNIFLWIRNDDIGLQWNIAYEPVLPTLYPADFNQDYTFCRIDNLGVDNAEETCRNQSGGPIRADDYPLELIDPVLFIEGGDTFYAGLCSHPFANRGYLCRPVQPESCETTGTEVRRGEPGEGEITLIDCQPQQYSGPIASRVSGPDICDRGGWRLGVDRSDELPEGETEVIDDANENPEIRPGICAPCAIDMFCSSQCSSTPGAESFAVTNIPDENGVITICLPEDQGSSGELDILALHELIHAQQFCGLSGVEAQLLTESAESCCAIEYEAYHAQCKKYEDFGILEAAGITVELCTSTLANQSCIAFQESDDASPCTEEEFDNEAIAERLADAISSAGLPGRDCTDVIEDPIPEVAAAKESLYSTCTPGCPSKYTSTIGNNLCFTGQCIEEAKEQYKLIPGRTPTTSLGEAFPWSSCSAEDPNLGLFATPSALTAPRFPTYRPEALLNALDRALCQLNGLPPRTPPVLCAFNIERRLNLPLLDFLGISQSLLQQPSEYGEAAEGLQVAANAIGARVAGDIFNPYFRSRAQAFAELIKVINRSFDEMQSIQFPTTMCPRFTDGSGTCAEIQGGSSSSAPST